MAIKQDKGAVARQLADSLRTALDTAQGKVEMGGELTWLEYARGKDLACHLRSQPELMEQLVRPLGPDRTVDDMINDVVVQLLQRKLLVACDRKFKKPKPGKTKLVKWPRTLESLRQQDQCWREESFYAWTYDRPASVWFYVMSGLVVVGVLAVTLFPLAPHWVRLWVLYLLTALLIVLLGTMLVRYLVFAVVWVVTGSHFWLLPNLMSETLPITEIFKPVISFEKAQPGKGQYVARAVTLALLIGTGYALHRQAPDAKTMKKNVADARNSLFEYLEMMAAKEALTGNTTTNTTANATAGAGAGASAAGRQGGRRDEAGRQQQRAAQQQQQQEEEEEEEEEDDEEEQEAELKAAGKGGSTKAEGEL